MAIYSGNRTLVIGAMLLFGAGGLAAQGTAAHPNFSGVWTLDTAKSSGDNLPSSATYTIVQHGDSLIVDRETTTPQGAVKVHLVWGTDGKTWTNAISIMGNDLQLSSVLTWSKDVLLINTTIEIPGGKAEQSENWTMAPGGKSFTYHRVTSVGGEAQGSPLDMVFVKKN